ncbi:IQ and ubiquitin-like domain-containing [Pelobates cultripes]|uniref:IQ and ubiquitin-like domain-containing n=1 Tax=Pelobates cultripes TaxID=61616 RepID=A0AAD1W260_PELCU|nr:IQ and ubiquitin-like domain-containing [Pelobates cultripes]
MEHDLTSQNADVAQQTDAIEEPGTDKIIQDSTGEESLLDPEQQQNPQEEEHGSFIQPSQFETEEQLHVSEEQPVIDEVTGAGQEEPTATEKELFMGQQTYSSDQEHHGVILEPEVTPLEQNLAADTVSEQTGDQTDQDSSTELPQTEQMVPLGPEANLEQSEDIPEKDNACAKRELENNGSSELSNSTATVKVMLVPDGQVVTMAFSIGYSVQNLKNYFAAEMKIPETVIRITFEGRVVEDVETLMGLGVIPHGTIQLEIMSLDPENHPLKAMKLQQEYSMPDVITVRVPTGAETYHDLVVEIERLNYRKPYLGGYRHKATGVIYHHAGTQTVPKKRPDKGIVVFCRDTQTVFEKNKTQQSRNSMSTQMTKIGCYVSNISDKLIQPKIYLTADEFHARRLKAVIVIQTYFRRFLAKQVVQQIREEYRLRLEWEAKEELRRKREKEERLRKDYERRMNPKTKEDFELLYHALEIWRKEEIERIDQMYSGTERTDALCNLLEQETQLIASIGRHKIDASDDNQKKVIQQLLSKCSQPKRWNAFDGKPIEMDTPFTIRARELRDIYNSIIAKNVTRDERLDALLTLKHTVKEHDCKLTQEIVELIDREADLLMRGVQDSNLDGLRRRISTLFLQYIKVPTFNPEVARLLKVPQDYSVLQKNIYFCPSCKSYLPSTEFSLSANAHTVGRCRKCCKLDNEARKREDFTKYKALLKQLKKSETEYDDGARIAYLLQQQDLQYLVENIWSGHSVLSACDDLYELAMVRWDKYYEWSPWNCILLTKDEAAAHLKLANAEQAYSIVFIKKIKHRHTLARNYFAQIEEMAPFLGGERANPKATINDLITSKTMTTVPHV